MDSIRVKLAEGGSIFGTWIGLANTISAEIIGQAGYDFVISDTQHGGISPGDLLPLLQVFDFKNTPALVRVNWTDPAQIMRALDLGAAGVVVPMVSNARQARIAAEAVRYPPGGIRSFGQVRSYYSSEGAVADPICLVMVETAEAMENLDAIASTPGVDGILVGPVDLALSLGLGPALVMPPEVFIAMDRVVAACRRHNIISASASLGLGNARELMNRGVQMIVNGADSLFIRAGAAADIKEMRSWQT